MRHKTIYYYFLLSYVLVFIGSFLVIDLWASYENKQLLIENKETELYDSLNVICVNTIHDKYNRVANGIDEDLKIQLRTYAKSLNCTLQIIDFKGNILYSSQPYEDDSIPDFNISDFGESNYKIGKFYNYFDDKQRTEGKKFHFMAKDIVDNYDVVILNFANCDMVGHTGNMEATIKAIETVDKNKRIIQ